MGENDSVFPSRMRNAHNIAGRYAIFVAVTSKQQAGGILGVDGSARGPNGQVWVMIVVDPEAM
jgi:hypothetical protein